jgi:chemotaxis-related protein WspB
MLFLVLQLREDRYAIDVAHIEEVLPFITVKELPGAPPGVAGLIDYYGDPVPVCDLSSIATGIPTAVRMSARIVMTSSPGPDQTRRRLGLLAPRATDVLRAEETDFVSTGVETPGTECFGSVLTDARGIIQRVDVPRLLTPAIRRAMFGADAA